MTTRLHAGCGGTAGGVYHSVHTEVCSCFAMVQYTWCGGTKLEAACNSSTLLIPPDWWYVVNPIPGHAAACDLRPDLDFKHPQETQGGLGTCTAVEGAGTCAQKLVHSSTAVPAKHMLMSSAEHTKLGQASQLLAPRLTWNKGWPATQEAYSVASLVGPLNCALMP